MKEGNLPSEDSLLKKTEKKESKKNMKNDYVIIKVVVGLLEEGMYGLSKENELHQYAI